MCLIDKVTFQYVCIAEIISKAAIDIHATFQSYLNHHNAHEISTKMQGTFFKQKDGIFDKKHATLKRCNTNKIVYTVAFNKMHFKRMAWGKGIVKTILEISTSEDRFEVIGAWEIACNFLL